MPINTASRSISLLDAIAENHYGPFLVYSRLAVPSVKQLNQHLDDHLRFTESLIDEGILPVSGPFFTVDGKNTGDGFYVLRVDNLEEARRITAEDPLQKQGIRTHTVRQGIRTHTVEPWLQVMN